MPRDAVVVDASALAALLFGEPTGSDMAERLDGRALLAPTLLRYELASVCLKKAREGVELVSLDARLNKAQAVSDG